MVLYPEDLMTPETIRIGIEKAFLKGHTYTHTSWPKDLWTWEHNEIIEYLADRFHATKDETEYYNIMPYLYKHASLDKMFKIYSRRFKGTVLRESSLRTNTRRPSKLAH